MNSKQKQITLLVFLIIFLIIINYSFLDLLLTNFLEESEIAFVERVIDGDTIVVDTAPLRSRHENLSRGKTSVRLLGINTPEKGEFFYANGKEFLEMIVLDKEVELRFGKDKYDKYNRVLAYVFYKGENVNLELVDEGYANFYFPSGKDKYYNKFLRAWEHCLENNKYLCEKSQNKCVDCIELQKFDYQNEIMVFYNKCDFDCELTNWQIKDEGRKKFIFPEFVLESNKQVTILIGEEENDDNTLYWTDEEYVFTKTGDTLFLRDDKGGLVLWESY